MGDYVIIAVASCANEGDSLLTDEGFEKIAVISLSLGGVFALKVGDKWCCDNVSANTNT